MQLFLSPGPGIELDALADLTNAALILAEPSAAAIGYGPGAGENGVSAGNTLFVFGNGFSYAAGRLVGGEITALEYVDPQGGTLFTMTGLSYDAGRFYGLAEQGADSVFREEFFAGGDAIFGGAASDYVFGRGGGDVMLGSDGNDLFFGNTGGDRINGNQGADFLRGGKDDDEVRGGKDDDRVFGDLGNDTVYGDLGNDVVRGGKGQDVVYGGKGDDEVHGDLGDDWISGDLGNDVVYTGEGFDIVFLRNGGGSDAIMDFQPGADRLQLDAGMTVVDMRQEADGVHVATSDGGTTILAGRTLSELSAVDIFV